MSDIASYNGDISESAEQQLEIPRLDRITNPNPAYYPVKRPPHEGFNLEVFNKYKCFINDILPNFKLDSQEEFENTLEFFKNVMESDGLTKTYSDLIIHAFLLNCNNKQVELLSNPSLVKFSHLHHIVSQILEIAQNTKRLSAEMDDHCAMMLADTADMYYSHFSDIAEHKFWGKTKSVGDLTNQLLIKEFERLRLLNQYTYHQLAKLAMRKAIDSAPNSSVAGLIQWAKSNNYPCE